MNCHLQLVAAEKALVPKKLTFLHTVWVLRRRRQTLAAAVRTKSAKNAWLPVGANASSEASGAR